MSDTRELLDTMLACARRPLPVRHAGASRRPPDGAWHLCAVIAYGSLTGDTVPHGDPRRFDWGRTIKTLMLTPAQRHALAEKRRRAEWRAKGWL